MRPARIVSLPWPPSSSLCLLRFVATIEPFSSALCIFRSPLIFGHPSWLVLARAAAPGSRTATPSSGVILRTMPPSLLAQAVRFSLVEGELALHRGVVVLAGAAPPDGGLDRPRRLRQRRLGPVRGAQPGARVGQEAGGDERDEEAPRDTDRIAAARRPVDDAEEEQRRRPHSGGEDHRSVAARQVEAAALGALEEQ